MKARTDAGERTGCGSAAAVIRNGTAYVGGEMQANQRAFDQACLARAHDRVRLAVIIGATGAVTLAGLIGIAVTDRGRRARFTPVTYTFGP